MKTSSLLTVAALSVTPAFAQTDECVNATDLGTGATSAAFDTNLAADTGAAATTSAEQQCFSLSDDVWFKWTATIDEDVIFDTCNTATFDTEIGLWEGTDCATLVPLGCNDDGTGCAGFTSLITQSVTAGQTYYIQLGYFSSTPGTFGAGTLNITPQGPPGPSPCDTADALEPNQGCANAVAVPGNSATALNVSDIDSDYYSLTVPDGENVTIDITHLVADGDIDAYLWDPQVACDTAVTGAEGGGQGELAIGFTGTDNEQLSYDNISGAAQNLVLEVRIWSGSAGLCSEYDLDLSFAPIVPAPDCLTPDVFEPNLDCASATVISDGTYSGLNVTDVDQDYYAVTVEDGATLDVQILFEQDFTDLDLYIWDPAVNCDTNVAGNNSPDALDVGFSVSDNEDATYTNMTGAAQNLIIEVDVFDGGTCNDYDLIVSGASDGVLGDPFCNPGIANTTGAVAIAGYEGSLSVAANDATLTVSQAPPFQFGIFVTSTTIVAPIPVADGQLCLAGDIGRYQFAGQIYGIDMAGNASLAIDLTQIPSTGPLLTAMAGETRGFQGWFRDVSPLGANFSEGVMVTFTP
ncbi:MAG: hypothetical protein AAFU73_14375 [Planctomycetota bacterium]